MPGFCIILSSASGGRPPRLKGRSLHFPPILNKIPSIQNLNETTGGHLEFPISKRFTSLVQDHPMIIPAKSHFNWLSGF
jgi:hypothetical protein